MPTTAGVSNTNPILNAKQKFPIFIAQLLHGTSIQGINNYLIVIDKKGAIKGHSSLEGILGTMVLAIWYSKR
jgi:hypothetical protein